MFANGGKILEIQMNKEGWNLNLETCTFEKADLTCLILIRYDSLLSSKIRVLNGYINYLMYPELD